MPDMILNGRPVGDVAERLVALGGDINALRPYVGSDGRAYITVNQNGKPMAEPVVNANATLRKDEWKLLDEAVVKAAKPRLRAVADLRGRGLQFVIPNGLAKTVLETENQSDISDAEVSMDGLKEAGADRPLYNLTNLPLPIIHKDFNYSARQVMVSRNGNTPLDTTTAELAARRVAELAEKLLIGVYGSYAFGGGTIYGYVNHPSAIPQVLTSPASSGWGSTILLQEVLAMKASSQAAHHYGPWVLYTAPDWDTYLDADFSMYKGDLTVRDRLKMIEGIEDVKTLDYMTGYNMVLVQMTSDVIREVVGMEITTVQWESQGGMRHHFKVMGILVPQIRVDFNGNTGLVLGATA